MRLLVCGGRDYSNKTRMKEVLSQYTFDVLICGVARGADMLAYDYAVRNKIMIHTFPAKWEEFGKAAGFIRNQQMLDEGKPDLIIAFPGGNGTVDMCKRGRVAGIEIVYVA